MIVDPITGEQTLAGETRDTRPNEFRDGAEELCAFCPGNEGLTPPELDRMNAPGDGWVVRAFTNKYPAMPEGLHEVIVDAPEHGREITRQGIAMWRRRYEAALAARAGTVPVLFKNRGAHAGATMMHPHTQMVVLDAVPERWKKMRRRFATDACPWCAEARAASASGLTVAENGAAVAFVRPASRFAWALSIVPRECRPSLDAASDAVWPGTGELLISAVEGLLARWNRGASFNVILPSDPESRPGDFHWHLELIPRIATLAGFELSTGMFVRSASAEESAARWRQLIALPHGSV
jgi:UDPglucose--hexose-1-phosphate uridylyltransferase